MSPTTTARRLTPAGLRAWHRVTVQQPGAPIPDGDGGYTEGWVDAAPSTWQVAIAPATARELETAAAASGQATTLTAASHLVTGSYRGDITTQSRLLFGTRLFQVSSVRNPDERNRELVLACTELVAP